MAKRGGRAHLPCDLRDGGLARRPTWRASRRQQWVAGEEYYHAVERERLAQPSHDNLATIDGCGPSFICRLPARASSYCFAWTDGPPGDLPPSRADGTDLPWLAVIDDSTGAILRDPADPRGWLNDLRLAFQTRVHRRKGDAYGWTTVVTLPPFALTPPRPLRISAGSGPTAVVSAPFGASSVPQCDSSQVMHCGIGK